MSNQNQTEPVNMNTPTPAAPLSFTVSAPALRAALNACAPAMSEDPARYILAGLYFELRPVKGPLESHSVLSIVGCDGRRLHVAQIPVYDVPAPRREASLILPAQHVKTLLKTCLPAKVKTGDVLIEIFRRAAALVNSAPVQWLRATSPAGEVSAPEAGGNYPNFRQVIPPPTIADDSFTLTGGDLLNVAEFEKDMRASFKARCLRAAVQSVNDRRLPYSEAQVESMIKKDINRMIKVATSRDVSAYFERTHAGRLIGLPLSIGPTPGFQITETGLVLINGEKDVALCYSGNPVGFDRPPAPARVAFNPKYLIDLSDALTAFDSAPGSRCGPLQAHDAQSSFCMRSDHPMDSGKGFSFYAVIMPQRMAR